MVPSFFSAWTRLLTKAESRLFLALWSLWEATDNTVLVWPDQPADSIWILESGELQLKKKTASGNLKSKSLIHSSPTPSFWLKSNRPVNTLVVATKGSKIWRLRRDVLGTFKLKHPHLFSKLTQPGQALESLADWDYKPPVAQHQSKKRLHPPLIFLLSWLGLALFLGLISVVLFGFGLQGGWLAMVLAILVLLERSFHWFGEYLELSPERLVYVKTDLVKRQHRRWSARWEDIQNLEVKQDGWLEKFFDLVNFSINTRAFAQPLHLKHWNSQIKNHFEMYQTTPQVKISQEGLGSIWEKLHPNQPPLKLLYPTPKKEALSQQSVLRNFTRHPLTLVMRTFKGILGVLGGAVLATLGMSLNALILIAVGMVLGFYGLGLMVWEWWDWVNDTYALEGTNLVDVEQKPFWLGSLRREIPLLSLQTIEVVQNGLLPILFDFGVLRMSSAGGGSQLDWIDLQSPSEVHRVILDLKKEEERRFQQQLEQKRFEEFAATLKTVEVLKEWGLHL